MRTTLDLPDATFRRLKARAAEQGVTLKHLLRVALERELERANELQQHKKIRFPVLRSKEPGKLKLTNADIENLLA
ncbi:MAG: hypothetical protein HY235_24065 [Acidobacteria bacterium]|nr:hypothetical protein [Acidobacteriota bacterium]